MANEAIHLGQTLDEEVLDSLADFICGDNSSKYPIYRSSSILTAFFQSVNINHAHDGSTRKWWVLQVLRQLEPRQLELVILKLVDFKAYKGDVVHHRMAVKSMKEILRMENLDIGFDGITPHIRRGTGFSFTDSDFIDGAEGVEGTSDFLRKQFPEEILISDLNLDPGLTDVLESRLQEVRSCPKDLAPLAIVILLGSSLEGLLLAVALSKPRDFVGSHAAPKNKGVVVPVNKWKLSDLIDVGHEVGLLDLDVKKYSHYLRQFRNFIHPGEQLANSFSPDQHTAEISWQVFRAAFHQIKRNQQRLTS